MQATEAPGFTLDAAFYDFTQDVVGALFEGMAAVRARLTEQLPPPPVVLQLRSGYAESPGWFLIQAFEFDPEPLTVAALRVRDVYASKHLVQALLEIMASEKWLDRRKDGEYWLADEGRTVMQHSRERRQRFLAELVPLFNGELEELEQLVAQVVAACQSASTYIDTWCLEHSRRRAPGADAMPIERIRQYLEDINAFRDDAHMAAWMPYGTAGHVWEAFSYVCTGQARTADALFEELSHRGYSREDYAEALVELVQRGWLEAGEAGHTVTQAGWEVREVVEELTDKYFYSPWKTLSEADLDRLYVLLTQLRDTVRGFASAT